MQSYHGKSLRILTLFLAGLLIATASGFGSTFRSGDNVHISSLNRIDDDLYAAGDNILIDGVVTGDLLAAGYRTNVKGEVQGSVNLLTRYSEFDGHSIGSLRFLGEHLILNGQIGGSVIAIGSEITFGQSTVVERDVTAVGSDVVVEGLIKGNAAAAGNQVRVSGTIEGDLELDAQSAAIVPPAVIKGNVTYKSPNKDGLDILEGVTVIGEVTWKPPERKENESKTDWLREITLKISGLLAAFLFGAIAVKLFRPYAEESYHQLASRFSVSLAAGVLGVLALAFCIILLCLSLLLSLVGTLLLSGELAIVGVLILVVSILMIPITSFASVSGGIILYSGKLVIAFLLGSLLMRLFTRQSRKLSKTSLIIGLVIVSLLCALPYYVGSILSILITVVGTGAIILGIKNCRRNGRIDSGIDTPPQVREDCQR